MLPPLPVIFLWPVAGAILFGTLRRPLAVIATVLGGYLLLPEGTALDLPLLPSLDKYTVPALVALVLSLAMAPRPGDGPVLPGLLPRLPIGRILVALLVLSAFGTVLTNGDTFARGPRVFAGLRPYDAFSAMLSLMMMLLPALLARRHLGTPEGHRLLLVSLAVAILAYSLPALLEIRLSPQMNRWFYGFFPHDWVQHFRQGGWRPIVFLSHGLVLSLMFCLALLAALGLSRVDPKRRTLWLGAALWLLMTLVLSKSLGALLIATILIPVVFLLSVRAQLAVSAIVAVIFLAYPVLRGSQMIPLDFLLETAAAIDPERAGSLEYRFDNEELLLEKARQRPVFGWGSWGRWRVFNDQGEDISVSDGYWVIVIGDGGWVGYVAKFGLLAMPILLLFRRSRKQPIGRETSILAVILAANLIDNLPNASAVPVTWMLAGALWGRLEHVPEAAEEAAGDGPAPAAGPRGRGPAHARARPPQPPAPRPEPRPSAPRPATTYTRQSTRIVRPGRAARR